MEIGSEMDQRFESLGRTLNKNFAPSPTSDFELDI